MPSDPINSRSGLGPAPDPGRRRALPLSRGRDRAHRLHHVVHVGEPGGEVAAGARRDPAAQGRELERLRVAAHRQAALAEPIFEHRAGRSRLDPGRARDPRPPRPPDRAPRGRSTLPRILRGSRGSIPPQTEAAAVGGSRQAPRRSTTQGSPRSQTRPAAGRRRPAGSRSGLRKPTRRIGPSRACVAREWGVVRADLLRASGGDTRRFELHALERDRPPAPGRRTRAGRVPAVPSPPGRRATAGGLRSQPLQCLRRSAVALIVAAIA